MQQVTTPDSFHTPGTLPEPEASEPCSWSRYAVITITDVCIKTGRIALYATRPLVYFLIYASVTPFKNSFRYLSYPFTRTNTTTPAHWQAPPQNLPKSIKDLEYKVVTDPHRVRVKLQKELDAAERQLAHCPKAFAGDPIKAKACYQKAPGISLPADKSRAVVTRTLPFGETTIHYEPVPETQTGIAYAQGAKPSMEDACIATRFTVVINNKPVDIDITGVFDGHGGNGWSQYASQHIIRHLKKRLEGWNPNDLQDAGIWNALKLALVYLDNEGALIPSGSSNQSFLSNLAISGTTANIALQINGDLWVINLGDSRAILIDNKGRTRQISEDAEPDASRYKSAIVKRGGNVLYNSGAPRVNGVLAVARSLGDHYLRGAMSARGKVTKIPARECSGGKLIQVCDGITEVAFSEDIARTVQHQLNKHHPLHLAAAQLLARAYQAGSRDNMSVMVTRLPSAPAS